MERTACAQCGEVSTAEARYCARCGAALSAPSVERPAGTTTPLEGPPLPDPVAAFLIYFFPLVAPIVALVLKPYKEREILRFHAWQSIFFLVLYVGLNLALGILTIPFTLVGLPLGAGLLGLTQFAAFLAWIYLMFQAVTGKPARLPYLAELADEQARKS